MFYVMHKYLSFSTPQISKIFERDVSTIQSGKARGQYIVDRNKFLVGLIEDAISKSRIKEKECD